MLHLMEPAKRRAPYFRASCAARRRFEMRGTLPTKAKILVLVVPVVVVQLAALALHGDPCAAAFLTLAKGLGSTKNDLRGRS
jgi:hypothetical protein